MDNNTSQTLAQGTVLHGTQYAYTIARVLGQGTFGITYLATIDVPGPLGDITMQVAVKEFFMQSENGRHGSQVTAGNKNGSFAYYRKRFLREARNLSRLHHPNIIKVLEAFEDNGTVYYSMEYVDGGSLDNLIQSRHRLSEADTLLYTRDIASALQCMHDNKMLHLDLKPSNVMLRDGHAVLIDFGLSKQYGADDNPETSISIGRGTHGYAPLEQDDDMRDSGGFPVTMDVYALGATMFKMLTGSTPPRASEILNFGFPHNEFQAKGISRGMTDIVSRAMAPMKVKRTPTVAALMSQIDAIKTGGNDTGTNNDATVISATAAKPTDGMKPKSYAKPMASAPQPSTYTGSRVKAGDSIDKVTIVFQDESVVSTSVAKRYVVTPQQVSMVKGMPPRTFSRALRSNEFEMFKQELQCLATCKKTGDDNMSYPSKSLTISLFCGQKIVKTYSVSTDNTHSYGNLRDNATIAHAKVLNILPKRSLLEENYERAKLAGQERDSRNRTPKPSPADKPQAENNSNAASATASKKTTGKFSARRKLEIALFCLTTATFLMERIYYWGYIDGIGQRFLNAMLFAVNQGCIIAASLSLLLFIAGATITARSLFSSRCYRPFLHAFIGMTCYGAATVTCQMSIFNVNFDNMMWPIAAVFMLVCFIPSFKFKNEE